MNNLINFIMKIILLMILTLILSCAPQGVGLSILVNSDKIYESTLIEDIRLFSEEPDSSIQIIALIKGSCISDLGEKEQTLYAIEGLKNEAARIGAHGIIIDSQYLTNNGGLYSIPGILGIGVFGFFTHPVIEGKAFRYIEETIK